MDQFVDYGELHVVEHIATTHSVVGSIEHLNERVVLVWKPLNVTESVRPQIAAMRTHDGNFPLIQVQPLAPHVEAIDDKSFGRVRRARIPGEFLCRRARRGKDEEQARR